MLRRRWGGVVCLCLAACTGSRYEVRTMGNPDTDLSGIRTYAWVEDGRAPAPRADDAWLAVVVREEADLMLAGQGLTLAREGSPDVIVETRALVHRRRRGKGDEDYTGIWTDDYRPNVNRVASDAESHYEVGKLLVRVLDPATGDLLWGASTETELAPRAPVDVRRARVRAAVRRMLDTLPR